MLTLAAHLGNLLDTRPGRSEKALALTAVGRLPRVLEPGSARAIAALIGPVAVGAWFTLRERAMLGDSGASLIGGMIGIAAGDDALGSRDVAARSPLLIAISLYGEFRSISSAIERVPLLERLDSVGRVN